MLADAAYSRCFITFRGNCARDRVEMMAYAGSEPTFFPCSASRGQKPISVWVYIEALLQVHQCWDDTTPVTPATHALP